MLSNSGHDERWQYHGGVAGDNNGTEWELRAWYSYPWNYVLRYSKNPDVGICISNLHIKAAKNNKVGYDQWQRNTYWNELVKAKYDPSKITIPCEADCSAGVIAHVKATGHILGIKALQNCTSTYTGNMRDGFKACGFDVLSDRKYLTSEKYLEVGDVLLNSANHTAVYVGDGTILSMSFEKKTYGEKYPNRRYPKIPEHKYFKLGEESIEVLRLQKYMNWYFDLNGDAKIELTSKVDKNLLDKVEEFQRKEKITVDRKFGVKSLAKAKTVRK